MSDLSRRQILKTGALFAGSAVGATGLTASRPTQKRGDAGAAGAANNPNPNQLVGSWTASPQQPTDEAGFTSGFEDQTIRNILRTSVGGSELRIRLANTFGAEAVTFDAVSVGVWDIEAETINRQSRSVTFNGDSSVTIRPGARAYSDPVPIDVSEEQNIAVDLYAQEPTGPPTTHADNRKTCYIASGNQAGNTDNSAFTSPASGESDVLTAWFFIEGVDVVNPRIESAVVCLGDSITDGVGSSLDSDSTYPDLLAERVNDEPSIRKSVLNAGIGGNRILNDASCCGINALARIDDDVLTQTEVTDVILLEGVNDIGFSELDPSFEEVTADQIIDGMQQIIDQARARDIRIFGGTLLPYKGALYYTPEGEKKRQAVNEFIRESGAFDGVIDFDRAVRDPEEPKKLREEFDSGDNLHPSDAGYQAMADAVDLNLLRGRVPAGSQ